MVAAWETRGLLGGIASTNFDLPWGFLPVCGSRLARVWFGSCKILQSFYCNFIVFGHNSEGLTSGHVG